MQNLNSETTNLINEEIESITRELNISYGRIEINVHIYHNNPHQRKSHIHDVLMKRKTSARRRIDSE